MWSPTPPKKTNNNRFYRLENTPYRLSPTVDGPSFPAVLLFRFSAAILHSTQEEEE